MILTGNRIKEEVRNGNIVIEPFLEENINPNSYNYRLAPELLVINDEIIDSKNESKFEKITIPIEGLVLQPGKLYLGSTLETIGSNCFVTSLIGRSSVGRLGLFLQITADLGHQGAIHKWTLELNVVQPLRVYPNVKIGQVSFWETKGDYESYCGKYHKFDCPHTSEIYKETN